MSKKVNRTYASFTEWKEKSKQTEYTAETPLLADDGILLAKGWARHNYFTYDRNLSKPTLRKKEWDFYQIANDRYLVQISFANISIGGYAGAKLVDWRNGEIICDSMAFYIGGKDNEKYILPPKGDVPNRFKTNIGKAEIDFDTKETYRTLYFKFNYKGNPVECSFKMDIMPNLENITAVLPFKDMPSRYFMTTKQNCMPCEGTYKFGDDVYEFSKEDTFCILDWGRVNTPYSMVWYWCNGTTYLTDENGEKHIFGIEATWAIGDESHATETCIFYDGKVHKVGAVDLEVFPKPDKYMQPWKFVSEDNRFNLVMNPVFDHHTDINAAVMRMHCHQVCGICSGNVILDDGTKLEIKDMNLFCEYVENRW